LKAVADAEHRAALAGELDDPLHQRREASDGAGAQVVAVREAARDHHGVDPAEIAVLVPEQIRLAEAPAGEQRVDLVAGAGEAHYAELHSAATTS
jgi:hypothetical protein